MSAVHLSPPIRVMLRIHASSQEKREFSVLYYYRSHYYFFFSLRQQVYEVVPRRIHTRDTRGRTNIIIVVVVVTVDGVRRAIR